jgi:uncharacterized protein
MENTIAQRLEALIHLQSIDSQLDNLHKLRGDLPIEVLDLENELIGFDTRIEKFQKDIAVLKEEISGKKSNIKDDDRLIKKYQEQQGSVRNNREYEAIEKEIELRQLDIQLHEKGIREANTRIEAKALEIDAVKAKLEERKFDLEAKREELAKVVAESQEEEAKYIVERDAAALVIEERLLFSYNRLRANARNGLAVVTVKRGACGGCFNIVPPQRQVDIRDKKKLIVCEHCGRILADVDNGEQIDLARGKSLASELARNTD